MHVQTFFDTDTATFSYVVVDESTKKCAIIDSVMDYDQASGTVTTKGADAIVEYIKSNGLENEWILETHIHADHITASFYLQEQVGGKKAMGTRITEVLKFWRPIFETEEDTPLSGEQFDQLFNEGDSFTIGNLEVKVWHTPGHTPACACYLIEDAIFVGDTIFAPYIGTARCDFPGGSARQMYNSVQRIYSLPDETKIYLCHDYPPQGQEPLSMTTVGEEKQSNVMIKEGVSEEEYVQKREATDKNKPMPRLILPSLQTNMRSGSFGTVTAHGHQFIKIPVNAFKKSA